MALVIGLTLGLLGGGGSILTVPVLVYLLAMDPIVATGYSLFIVGVSSFFGAFSYWTKKRVDFKVVAVLGSASIAAVYLARRVIVPAIPDEIFQIGDFMLTPNMSIMVLFALLMLGPSYSMITGETSSKESQEAIKYNYLGL
ncbi:MAG: sulfite exporter TauE/SafE family protein, partial [Flavobacteriales bacterium]|nr:sulfite exporter TauE/SafE family protein [Flavobacteriales bacterium]